MNPTSSSTQTTFAIIDHTPEGEVTLHGVSTSNPIPHALPHMTTNTLRALLSQTAFQESGMKLGSILAVSPVFDFSDFLSTIISILTSYDPEFTADTVGYLPLKVLLPLAKSILLLLPAKSQPALAQKALYAFFSDRSFEKAESQLVLKAYMGYWESCGTSSSQITIYQDQINAVLYLENSKGIDKTSSLTTSATLNQRRTALKCLSKLIKELSVFLEVFWEASSQSLTDSSKYFLDRKEKHEILKKSVQILKIDSKHADHQTSEHTYNNAIQLLSQIKLYTHDRIPQIKFHCARVESDHSYPIKAVGVVFQRCQNGAFHILNQLIDVLARFEAYRSQRNGVFAVSHKAMSIMRESYTKELDARFAFLEDILGAMSSIMDEHGEALKLAEWNKKQMSDCLGSIANAILAPTSKTETKKDAKKLSSLGDIVTDKISRATLESFKKYKNIVEASAQGLTKNEQALKDKLSALRTYTAGFFGHLQSQIKNAPSSSSKKSWYQCLSGLGALFIENAKAIKVSADSDSAFLDWIKQAHSEGVQCKSALRKKGKITQSDKIDSSIIQHTANTIFKCQALQNSINFFGALFTSLSMVNQDTSEMENKIKAVKADDCLHLLELEEEADAAKKAYEEAEKAQKEKTQKDAKSLHEFTSKQATSVAPPQSTTSASPTQTTKVMPPLTSCFKSPGGQLLFNLRNEISEWHSMMPAEYVPPAKLLGTPTSTSSLAVNQQLYANDGLAAVIEMLSTNNVLDKKVLVQLVLQWGFLALEQGLTVEHAKSLPNRFLRHDLKMLLQDLEISHTNLWTEQANRHSLYQRYPFYFQASEPSSLPFALKHLQQGSAETTKELCNGLSKWVADAASLQVAALSHKDKQNPQLTRIQATLELFQKSTTAQAKKESAEKNVEEGLSKDLAQKLVSCEEKLKSALALVEKRIKAKPPLSTDAAKALSNARHHLSNLKSGLGLLISFPQQRFLHVLFHLLHSSIKDFAENLGVVLSLQTSNGWYSHLLKSYCKNYGLGDGLKSVLLNTLSVIDVEKGNEYPYKYFASTHSHPSALMNSLSEFYARSKEAFLIGEGAVPSGMKKKTVAELQTEIVDWAVRFSELACALASKHLT